MTFSQLEITTNGRNPGRHQGNNIRQVGRDKLSQEGVSDGIPKQTAVSNWPKEEEKDKGFLSIFLSVSHIKCCLFLELMIIKQNNSP